MSAFDEIFFSGTHGGEALSLAAAAAVLDVLADGTVLADIEARGRRMSEGIEKLIAEHGVGELVSIGGEPQRRVVQVAGDDLVRKSWIQQCLVERGILHNGALVVCARHTDEDVARTVEAFDEAFAGLASGDDLAARLKGPPVQPVFRAP